MSPWILCNPWISFPSRVNSAWALEKVPLNPPFIRALRANSISYSFLPAITAPLPVLNDSVIGPDPRTQRRQRLGLPIRNVCMVIPGQNQILLPEPQTVPAGYDPARSKKARAFLQMVWKSRMGMALIASMVRTRTPSGLRSVQARIAIPHRNSPVNSGVTSVFSSFIHHFHALFGTHKRFPFKKFTYQIDTC